MTARLNVSKVIYGAFMVPWWNRRAFFRALAIPFALLVALSLSWRFGVKAFPREPIALLYVLAFFLYSLYGALFSLFAVTCHRLVLLDTESVASRVVPRWSWRETRFFFWLVTVWAVLTVTAIAVSAVILTLFSPWAEKSMETWARWVPYVAGIPAFYLFARLCLVFPATAIDRKVNLKWTWKLTRRNGWRLLLVVAVLPWLISEIIALLYRGDATAFETVILTLLGIALFAVEIAAVSLSYRELTREEFDAGAAQEQNASTGSTDS